ncbi:MAG: hypothetical protein N2491_02485 [Negativicutes bacterium]|nr:hypothetical protein [Negativicutes bacterium]
MKFHKRAKWELPEIEEWEEIERAEDDERQFIIIGGGFGCRPRFFGCRPHFFGCRPRFFGCRPFFFCLPRPCYPI